MTPASPSLGFPGRARPDWPVRRLFPAVGRRGMVCAAHPLTVAAGVWALQQGGNAVDAAIAAAATASVVMPEMCGLGGDLFAIVHRPGEPAQAFLGSGVAARGASLQTVLAAAEPGKDGTPRMPLRGPLAIATPGMVDAWRELLARYGTKSFAELAAPAIGHAEGVPLTVSAAAAIRLYAGVLRANSAAAEIFLPGGSAPAPGEILVQHDLARTLRGLARDGLRSFYEGDLAGRIAEGVQALGGGLAATDLAAHTTPVEPPLAVSYRGRTVMETGLPSQGFIMLEALNILAEAEPAVLAAGGASALHLMAEALKAAYADRLEYAQDPAFGPTPMGRLLSRDWARRRFAGIDPQRAASEARAPALQDGDTTYLCTADGDGLMVSLIQSVSSAFGSGVVAPGTGVLLNNRAGRGFSLAEGDPNLYAPGKKTMHTLGCWMIADEAGQPVVAGGTPGGDGQPQWGLQVVSALIDRGLDVQLAADMPRFHIWPGTDPHDRPATFELRVETRLGEQVLAGLEARGHTLRPLQGFGDGGAVQLIARDPATGSLMGGSDPRVDGLALGL